MKRIRLATSKLKFEPGDLWIGLYWKYDREVRGLSHLHFFICLVPMFPLHLMFQIGAYQPYDEYWMQKTGTIQDR